jgi:alkaline phosphatase
MNRDRLLLAIAFVLMVLPSMAVKHPKNVIFLIGDGMGLAQTYAGMVKNKAPLSIESFRQIGIVKTYSASHFTTDSGAGGTALASGVKTKNGMIGMNPDSVAVESILQLAEKNNLSTGIVSACAVTHATPASFVAHQINRNMYEAIAADYLKVDVDVFIGGGKKYFANRTSDERNLIDELQKKNYKVVESLPALLQVQKGKIAGLLYEDHPPAMPERGDFLPQATRKAIELLQQSRKGFFLMVEGSQIDWAGHDNDSERIALEVIDFDRAVKAALDFAREDGNTLVIVTADHETGAMSLLDGSLKNGEFKAAYSSGNHSGIPVPVYAFGPGAAEFTGFIENIDFKEKIASLLRIK